VFVLERKQRPLLGRPAMLKFKLIDPTLFKKPKEVMSVSKQPEEEFESVFEGMGVMPGEYTVKIKPNNEPFSIKQARRIAVPLLQPTAAELLRMEGEGIITQVDKPLAWCAGMVPVLKKDGSVRICVDFSQLNRFIERERGMSSLVSMSVWLLYLLRQNFSRSWIASRVTIRSSSQKNLGN